MMQYIKQNKKIIIFIFLIAILLFIQKIICPSIGYDTDQYLADPEETHRVWISHGRYAFVFMSHFLGKLWMNLRIANILTCINIAIYTVLFLAFLNMLYENKDKKRDTIVAVLLISSPIFLEQYYFTLQAVEVSFSLILIMLAYIGTYYWIVEERKKYIVIVYGLLTFCFGVYQTHVVLYIIGVLMILIRVNHENHRENILVILRSVLVWGTSLVTYFVIKKIVEILMDIPDSGYLESQITWLSGSVTESCFMIMKSVGRVVFGIGHVLNLSYLICVIYVLWRIKKSDKTITWKNFYLLSFLIAPILLNIIMASRLLIRSVLGIPIACAVVFWKSWRESRYMRTLMIIVAVSQVVNGQLLLYADNIRYSNDVSIAEKIYRDCHADKSTVIVTKGIEKAEDNGFSFKGQTLGHSFFEWSNGMADAEETRIQYFMHLQGLDFKLPDEDQKQLINTIGFQGEYPEDGYTVEKDGCWYVNLGE